MMKKKLFIFLFLFAISPQFSAYFSSGFNKYPVNRNLSGSDKLISPPDSSSKNEFDFESNLPIIIIETDGQEIPEENKITARMKVVNNKNSEMNNYHDPDPEYNGFIGIEVRGRFSAWFPQKPYGLETRDSSGNNSNVSLLGMPKENDWILIPNYNDKSFVRNILSFYLYRSMGHYSSRAQLCEVFLNSDYRGVYVFCEKIKQDKKRVEITELPPENNSGNDLTGGYIISVDYYSGGDNWISSFPPFYYPDRKVHYNYYYPKPYEITPAQKLYIKNFIRSAEGALYGPDFADAGIGYSKYIDVASFIDYFIISEVSRNVDGYKKSRFFYKDRNDKDSLLCAGPVWDFDWAWKNIDECFFANTDGSGWAFYTNDCHPSFACPDWHIRLLQDGKFTNRLIARYQSLRSGILNLDFIYSFIDSIKADADTAKDRHFALYPIDDPNAAPEVEPPSQSYEEEIQRLKNWIRTRIEWLDVNIPKLREQIITQEDTIKIDLVNSSFESPGTGKIKGWDGVCADPGWQGLLYDILGWSSDVPAFNSGVESDDNPSDGNWYAFLMASDPPVYQSTGYVILSDDAICLKVDAWDKNNSDFLKIELTAMDSQGNRSSILNKIIELSNDMGEYELRFNAADYPESVGKYLGVSLENTSTSDQSLCGIDNVRLFRYVLTGVNHEDYPVEKFSLSQNFPNPFNSSTNIQFSLPQNCMVNLSVYDILGRRVAVLIDNDYKAAGNYNIVFEAGTNQIELSSGIYFYRILAGTDSSIGKMLLIK